ncbi:MAG: acyltransferase [Bacteroidales bacterium]|nr:acyltransferase [Bacteroidales bacterium]
MERNAGRIKVLDSFRFFAIIGVMFYHYFHRWAPPHNDISFYPYKPTFNLFSHGDLGVEFFFIISGFVIAFTLEGTDKLHVFWKKRMIRLLPAMITCSLITLLVCSLVDTNQIFPKGQSFTSFFYSITFLSPDLLNVLLKNFSIQGDYVNGSYWSLWAEVQFYFLVSIVFFLNKKHFVRNFYILSLTLFFAFKLLFNVKYGSNFLHITATPDLLTKLEFWVFQVFSITTFINWFLMGVLFYKIYSKGFSRYVTIGLVGLICVQFLSSHIWEERVTIVLMVIAFFALILYEEKLEFLNMRLFTNIGAASYSLYLIHENIGVVLINRYAASWGEYAYLFPLPVIAVLIGFSMLHFKFIEKPVGKFLR